MLRSVRLLSAHQAPGGRAVGVRAAEAGGGWLAADTIRWMYLVDVLQWLARSWWMSIAASRLSSRTGAGRVWSGKMERYQPPGQLSCHELRVVLSAARVMLLTSRWALVCFVISGLLRSRRWDDISNLVMKEAYKLFKSRITRDVANFLVKRGVLFRKKNFFYF